MMQRRRMEFLKDYDFDLKYHLGKANKVANALSRKEMQEAKLMIIEYDLLEKSRKLELQYTWTPMGVLLGNLNVMSDLKKRIRQA